MAHKTTGTHYRIERRSTAGNRMDAGGYSIHEGVYQ